MEDVVALVVADQLTAALVAESIELEPAAPRGRPAVKRLRQGVLGGGYLRHLLVRGGLIAPALATNRAMASATCEPAASTRGRLWPRRPRR